MQIKSISTKCLAHFGLATWLLLTDCSATRAEPPNSLGVENYLQEREAPRKALIVGVGQYQFITEQIPNAPLDAVSFSERLKAIGFKVETSIDEGARSIWDRIRKFSADLNPGEVGLFYFSGHGFQYNGQSYLVAADTKDITQDNITTVTIAVDSIIQKFEESGAAFSIILLDACRENKSLPKSLPGTPKGFGEGKLTFVREPLNSTVARRWQ